MSSFSPYKASMLAASPDHNEEQKGHSNDLSRWIKVEELLTRLFEKELDMSTCKFEETITCAIYMRLSD